MRKLHLGLVQQLGRLETRQCEIGDAITEVKRRIAILEEVMSWGMPEGEEEVTREERIQEPAFVTRQEPAFVEELPEEEEIFEDELPQEEVYQEEFEEEFEEEEEPSLVPSMVDEQEEDPFPFPSFRDLDTEGTEIQWVNR